MKRAEPASRSAELGEVRSDCVSPDANARWYGTPRQTAADTRRGVARLQRCRRAPVSLPFSCARWRAFDVVAAASSRSRLSNGGESRYARSSQLVESHPFDVSPLSPPPPSPSSSSSSLPSSQLDQRATWLYHRIVDSHHGCPCIALVAPVDT